ncbi:YtnP family quorum-quenching lactonase [Rummeliibacillus suwonensis]|uniref:YtnP family quorum-quenching lactonase n=1 Tax=Rummeliibacillus suwonensis TaxID=1306154 RepID=UPI0011B46AE6|nr:MBL fold metallo-hydrolase [Rummeliibacillus suwonensis]MBO2536077.1 MBL fold metallo-hydrolase [Rummeliibacillus suwonensis]
MDAFQFHDMKLTWLNGGVTHLDGGAMFGVVPKPLWSRKYPANDSNQIELRTDPILIQYQGKNLLIDSGIGNEKFTDKQLRNYGITEQSKIVASLGELGLTTNDIDYILMTHLHFDHACGLTRWQDDQLIPTFENATILVSQVEWDEMRDPNIRSVNTYWEANWKSIVNQVKTFEQQLEVLPGILMVHTGGHSDGHCIIRLTQKGETIIHMADIMPTHAHQNPLWVLAYDDYPMTSVFAKQKLVREIVENGYWVSFYHDAYKRLIKWDTTGKNIIAELPRTRESHTTAK